MIIYPAIDIRGGKCVRLVMGRASDETVYGDDPATMAVSFERAGAKALHVVDLDGAFSGKAENLEAVGRILASVSMPVQLGGGIRTMEAIDERLGMGVSRVVLGTAALNDLEMTTHAAKKYPGRIVAGIDALGGFVAINGWTQITEQRAISLAKILKRAGISSMVYTDIMRDGTLEGPNFNAIREMVEQSGMQVIASGGVSCLADLLGLKPLGVSGAIVGKAIYDGHIDLAEALAALGKS